MSQPDEVQGVVEIKVESQNTGEELLLRHLSGDEAATLAGIFCPVGKGVGTLRSVTLLVADAGQAEAVAGLIRRLDVPALRRAADSTEPSSAEESFFAALRCVLAMDGRAAPDYRECREHLARVLAEQPEESWLSVHARRALAWLDRHDALSRTPPAPSRGR